jgi:hypothetical protein
MGWVPEDEFKGDKSRWIEAEKFLERGRNELPILRERLKKQDSKIVSMQSTFAEYQKRQHDLETRAYNRALKDLTERQKKAVVDGDLTAYEAAELEKKDLAPPAAPPVDENAAAAQEFDEWRAENTWYDSNKELQAYASTISSYVQTRDGLSGKELYDAVREEVKLRFPDKFENKNKSVPSAVVGSGDAPPAPSGGKTFNDLPKDAQQQCLRFMKDIPGFTKKEYIESYEWE